MILRRMHIGVGIAAACLGGLMACVADDPTSGNDVSDAGDAAATDGATTNPFPCTDPTAPVCGAHGKCPATASASTPAACTCDTGYSGSTCAGCATGYQDNDKNGTCSPSCTATTCSAHSTCSDTSGKATCTCGLDYVVPGDAGACTWGGGLLDPGFQNTPPAWTIAAGAVLEPAAAGDLDPGDVHFDQGTICTTEGTVTQTFTMPAFSSAEPLALRVVGKLTCSSGDQGCASEGNGGPGGENHGFGIALNQGYELLPMVDAYSSQLLCLGERAYGGPLSVVVSAEGNSCSDDTLQYDGILDHADVEPSSVCPLPEVITDADFEASPVTGWALSAGGGTAEIAAGDGTLGTRGGHIAASTLGDSPTVTQMLSLPTSTSVPHPALSIDYNALSGDAMQLSMNGQEFGELVGTGASSTVHVCVPSWAAGLAAPVTLGIDSRGDGNMGANTPIFDADFTFDNLAWLTSPTCPADADIIDPSFELTGSWRPWILRTAVGYMGTTIAAIGADAAAHQGAQSLHLSTTTICATASAFAYFTIPAGTATAGPALTFWYKWAPSGTSTFASNLVSGVLPAEAAWTQQTVCLDPKHVGRPQQISFQTEGFGPGGCVLLSSAASAFVDDLALTTSPSCPH